MEAIGNWYTVTVAAAVVVITELFENVPVVYKV
jgi:hypothetical protein